MGKETQRPKGKRLQFIAIIAIGLVCDVSPTLDLLAAVAARVTSSKLHSPFISTLRIGFRFGCGCPTQSNHQADNLAKLWQEFLSVIELIAKIFGAVAEQQA